MNVPLLRKIQRAILAESRRLNMSRFSAEPRSGSGCFDSYVSRIYGDGWVSEPPCGIVGCIAGWAMALGTPVEEIGFDPTEATDLDPMQRARLQYIMNRAAALAPDLLGINARQAYELFHVDQWVSQFRDAYKKSRTPEQRAQIVSDVLDHYIEVWGSSL